METSSAKAVLYLKNYGLKYDLYYYIAFRSGIVRVISVLYIFPVEYQPPPLRLRVAGGIEL